jgi:hypothetical protein
MTKTSFTNFSDKNLTARLTFDTTYYHTSLKTSNKKFENKQYNTYFMQAMIDSIQKSR